MSILKKIRTLTNLAKIKIKEKKFNNSLPYIFEDNGSDKLLIIFSAFTGEKRRYNYIKSLKILKYDKLFILDPYGYMGSYNLYENGDDLPKRTTVSLIEYIINRKNTYNKIYTLGSSKGGTCAIYFGLLFNVDVIFSGACQYNLGSYLFREDHERIFKGMMGVNASQKEADILNEVMPKCLSDYTNAKTQIHLIYSVNELTYQRQIVDLLRDLKHNKYNFVEKVCYFKKHEEISTEFIPYIKKYFNIN